MSRYVKTGPGAPHPAATRASGRPAPGTYGDLPAGLPQEFLRLCERALPLLDTRANDLHARVSCQYVVEILAREGGELAVAIPAMLLHDIGWREIPEDEQRRAFGPNSSDPDLNRQHEVAGARLARQLLEEEAYAPALIEEICRIIDGHDSRPTAETVEEAAVKDSDKVWRMSRLGFPVTLELMPDITPQEYHDFVAVRATKWFLTRTGYELVQHELAARREEYGLAPAPDIPPPPGYGIGDLKEYSP